MDTNLTSHAQLAVQINPTCVGLWFHPNLPPKPTKHSVRFHRSICGFHWRYLGASRHLTSSQASQVAGFRARPRFWHGQKYVGRCAVHIFLLLLISFESLLAGCDCSRDFDTERSMRGQNVLFLSNRFSLQEIWQEPCLWNTFRWYNLVWERP